MPRRRGVVSRDLHAVLAVTVLENVVVGLRYQASGSTTEEHGPTLFDYVFTRVVRGSLREPQVALINLLHQINFGDVLCLASRHKTGKVVAAVVGQHPAY